QIENRPAIELIQDFNYATALIYCDPPYLLNTRSQKQYAKEMTDQDHKDLLEVLRNHKGYVIISGYQSELYDDILHGWHKKETISRTQSGEKKKEILWMNFEPEGQQISMFEVPGVMP
ncbi:MAG: DNA adenine methylase, partial [Ruminococcus sp.]